MKNDDILSDIDKKILLGRRLGVFNDSLGQKLLKLYGCGILDPYTIGQINKRVDKALRKEAFTDVPFRLPHLHSGELILGADQNHRPVKSPIQYLNAGTLLVANPFCSSKTIKYKFLCYLINQSLSWIIRCQQSEGFGLWPTSSPRLCSTYQAISILKEKNALNKCDAEKHASWIKTFQQPKGYFKGPWSKRDKWEDTFFAIQSLSILKSSLPPDEAEQCKNWTQTTLFKKGFEENRADVIYYCVGILDALNELDRETYKEIHDWLTSKIKELLLANIALNYESVHFTVMIYQMLCFHTTVPTDDESITLLTERIYAALKAELADVRI